MSCLQPALFALFLWGSLLLPSDAQSGGAVAEVTEAEFRVAKVDFQGLFKSYHKTLSAQREINTARVEIEKKSQEASKEIRDRRRRLTAMERALKSGELKEEEIEKLRAEGPLLFHELRVLEEEKEAEQSSSNQMLNQQMVRRMRGILDELTALTRRYADEAGFDLVIDTSGRNSNQAAPILFVKGAEDITELLKKELSNPASTSR